MKSPFKYGKVVTGDYFINRKDDISRIQNNISASINTILISPRRWGKSSLMKQIQYLNKDKKLRFAYIDFFNIRTEEEFLEKYAKEIINCSISKKEELLDYGKQFFKKLTPTISFGADPMNDFSLKFSWDEMRETKDEIINLPEAISKKKGIKVIVCIDEFQNISRLKESVAFEQELRSYWQYHENAVYCLYGSRKHMMLEIFRQESRAFFRFGDLFMLDKIPEDHWMRYISEEFANSDKAISTEIIGEIIETCNNHPDYLQQVAHNVWNMTSSEVNGKILQDSVDMVVTSNALHYQGICESLSNTQLNLLKAILNGEKKLTSTKTMQEFKLGTPRNVIKNKHTLIEKDIIELHPDMIGFTDPIFEFWLRNYQTS